MKKIAILGAESSGKTKLCEQLAKHYNCKMVSEFAREYFDKHDINNYTIDDLEIIAKKQIELENSIDNNNTPFLFCDTTLITIKIWSIYQFNKVPNYISNTIKATDYDLYLICNNDVEWVKDEQRRHENLRDHLLNCNIHELEKLNADYYVVEGIGNERLQSAISIIDNAFKF